MATTQVGVYQNRGQLSAQSFQQLRLHQQRELAGQDTPGLRERLKSNSLQVSTNIKIDAAVKVEISSEARAVSYTHLRAHET